MPNEVTIFVREQGTAQTGAALSKFQTLAVGVGAAVGISMATMAAKATSALTDLAKGSITAASNMQESASKARVVFGEAADSISAFAKDSATNLGLSNQAALEMAGTFGNLFTAMGISRGGAADMSKSILQLGADLASFNNIPVEEALLKIRAGLVGEAEPLRTLGVNLNEAAIQQEAMRLGLLKTGETLSAANKAQAAYSLILQQTTNAQGDFARTSDGLANQQRILAANVENLKAKFGEALLPAVTEVVQALNDWAKSDDAIAFADNLTSAVKKAVDVTRDLAGVLKGMVESSPFQIAVKVTGEALGFDTGANPILKGIGSVLGRYLNPLGSIAGDLGKVGAALPEGAQRALLGTDYVNGKYQTGAGGPPSGGWKTVNEEAVAQMAADIQNAAKAGVENIANTIKGGGAGGQSPLESAWEHINSSLLDELVRAGEDRLQATQEEQARLLEETVNTATRMADILGVDLAKTLIPAFETIRDREKEAAEIRVKTAKEAAEQLIRWEKEIAAERLALTQRLWSQFNPQNAAAANNLAILAAAAAAGDTTLGGNAAAANAVLNGGGTPVTINIAGEHVADVIIPAINQAGQMGPVINSGAVG